MSMGTNGDTVYNRFSPQNVIKFGKILILAAAEEQSLGRFYTFCVQVQVSFHK